MHRVSVGKARLSNWYHLLYFYSENTVQHFSEPRSTHSNATRLYSLRQNPIFGIFFAFLSIFTCKKPPYARQIYLLCTFWFVFIQKIWPTTFCKPTLERSKCFKALFMPPIPLIFTYFRDFYVHKASVDEPRHTYLIA